MIQPTGASVDDLHPAVLTFHELVREGIPKARLVFALCKIGTDAEEAEARTYIAQAGFDALAGFLPERPAYRQAQNIGLTITETRFPQLNAELTNYSRTWWTASMADFKKLRRNLPPPPTAAEVAGNLAAPETAPADGRTARATGRTKQLATRVREDFHDELKMYAAKHRLKLVEVLEQGHEALKASKQDSS